MAQNFAECFWPILLLVNLNTAYLKQQECSRVMAHSLKPFVETSPALNLFRLLPGSRQLRISRASTAKADDTEEDGDVVDARGADRQERDFQHRELLIPLVWPNPSNDPKRKIPRACLGVEHDFAHKHHNIRTGPRIDNIHEANKSM